MPNDDALYNRSAQRMCSGDPDHPGEPKRLYGGTISSQHAPTPMQWTGYGWYCPRCDSGGGRGRGDSMG
jgi:hypothetical protein